MMGQNCGEADNSNASVISADFLGPKSLASSKSEFLTSQPFAHVVFRNLCNRDVLLKARRELIDNVEAKFKETDLFKARSRAWSCVMPEWLLWSCTTTLIHTFPVTSVPYTTLRIEYLEAGSPYKAEMFSLWLPGIPNWRSCQHGWT